MSKRIFVSRARSLKDMVKTVQAASERRAECEQLLAQLAAKNFSDLAKTTRIVERITREANSPEFQTARWSRLMNASGFQPTQKGPLNPILLDAAATKQIARSAQVRGRDLRTGQADKKLARARGNQLWAEITHETLDRRKKKDVKSTVRRRLMAEDKRSRRADIKRAFETVVSVIREVDGKVPGYTRDPLNEKKVRVPVLDFLQTAVELLTGSSVSPSAETAVKWLQRIGRAETLAPTKVFPSSWSPSSVLERIPDAEREFMRADSVRNLGAIRSLGGVHPAPGSTKPYTLSDD